MKLVKLVDNMSEERDYYYGDGIYSESDEKIATVIGILFIACNPVMWIIIPIIMLNDWIGLKRKLRRLRKKR